jgi:excinuclease ABC subunit C
LNQVYALKKCSARVFPNGFRACLNYHIKQCDGICQGTVSPAEYAEKVELAADFLKGRTKGIIDYLQKQMMEASEKLDFERAAEFRDYIIAAKALSEKQRVTMQDDKDVDLILVARGAKQRHVVVFFLREGKLIGRENYDIQSAEEDTNEEIIAAFIKQHYSDNLNIPKEIILDKPLDEEDLLQEYLSHLAGHQVKFLNPKKGEKRAILELAKKDVVEMVKTIDDRANAARERIRTLGGEIFGILREMGKISGEYRGQQFRVEAYDISNTNGVDTVGAMVVFNGLKADRQSYRKFKVRSIEGQDDYGSMREVLSRRFMRALQGDESFEILPDIVLMDGGKGHVSAALEVLDAAELDIPVIGMVKDDKHRTRALVYRTPDRADFAEIPLAGKPLLFKYMGRIQEEVHRFAIEYHRKLRNKRTSGSVLDEIPGIGPVRRDALLKHFKSVDAIRAAQLSELEAAPEMNSRSARSVWEYFHKK